VTNQTIVEIPCVLDDAAGGAESWLAYGVYFREGIL